MKSIQPLLTAILSLGLVGLLQGCGNGGLLGGGASNVRPIPGTDYNPGSQTPIATPTPNPSATPVVYPAAHPPMPQVLSNGGIVMNHPRLMSITFQGDSIANSLDNFVQTYAASSELKDMTAEYGVSVPTVANPAHLTETAPTTITDDQIHTWLQTKLHATGQPLGAPDANTLYVLFYPATTTVTFEGLASCQDFGGYHFSFTDSQSGIEIIYAVLPRCGTDANSVTPAASHEIAEAVTDPVGNGYFDTSPDFAIWQTFAGGLGSETSDMCENYSSSFPSSTTFADMSYSIQRSWSNASAAAGSDPCVSLIPGEVYFNAAPVLSDVVTYTDPDSNTIVTTKGVKIPLLQSKTIELDLYSSGPLPAWTLSGSSLSFSSTGAIIQTNNLSFSFSKPSGKNGDKIQVTITAKLQDAQFHAEPFYIKSTYNGTSHIWFGVVGN